MEAGSKMELDQIISTMRSNFVTQLALCEELEAIADSLPSDIDTQKCLQAARTLYPAIKRAHDFEENKVFPLLSSDMGSYYGGSQPPLASSLERLRYEHWEDESFAEELSDALASRITDVANAETIGYMLRGFFEGLRRHIAFETDHILPLLVRRLEAES